MGRLDDVRIRQLDNALAPFASLRERPPPSRGWIKAIREALGMSLRQLAERTGVSKTSVQSAEVNEVKGTIQLDSLEKIADALECDLVYALVPRSSLGEALERQAERRAEHLVGSVSDSMELEAQGVSAAERERQIEEMAATILRDRGQDFWDD